MTLYLFLSHYLYLSLYLSFSVSLSLCHYLCLSISLFLSLCLLMYLYVCLYVSFYVFFVSLCLSSTHPDHHSSQKCYQTGQARKYIILSHIYQDLSHLCTSGYILDIGFGVISEAHLT